MKSKLRRRLGLFPLNSSDNGKLVSRLILHPDLVSQKGPTPFILTFQNISTLSTRRHIPQKTREVVAVRYLGIHAPGFGVL